MAQITERSQKVTCLCRTNPLIESTNATHSSQLSSSWGATSPPRASGGQQFDPRFNLAAVSIIAKEGTKVKSLSNKRVVPAHEVLDLCVFVTWGSLPTVALRDGLGLGSESRTA